MAPSLERHLNDYAVASPPQSRRGIAQSLCKQCNELNEALELALLFDVCKPSFALSTSAVATRDSASKTKCENDPHERASLAGRIDGALLEPSEHRVPIVQTSASACQDSRATLRSDYHDPADVGNGCVPSRLTPRRSGGRLVEPVVISLQAEASSSTCEDCQA